MWLYKNKPVTQLDHVPLSVVGFIYLIEDVNTPFYYIGRKNLYSVRTLPPLKGYKRKRKVFKQSNWVNYQSSNDTVKKWISPKKTILKWCYSKKEMTYEENKALYCHNVLEDPNAVNENISGKFYKQEFKKD